MVTLDLRSAILQSLVDKHPATTWALISLSMSMKLQVEASCLRRDWSISRGSPCF